VDQVLCAGQEQLVPTIPFAQPWITEDDRRAVNTVLDGPILTHGLQMEELEKEFAGYLGDTAHCVAVSSCMAALHLAYVLLGIGHGDEVIVPAQTHVATAHAVEIVGARPVFVDCELETGNLILKQIESAITRKTKAISVVHFLGIPVKMPEVMALAESHGLKVVEDCALALGSRYADMHVGLFGDVGCFSFYPIKHITSGEGGMFVTRHSHVASKARLYRAFGTERSNQPAGRYDVSSLGLNYRLSELASALARSQLRRIDQNLAMRARNFSALKTALADLPLLAVLDKDDPNCVSSHYCLSVVLRAPLSETRDSVISELHDLGVGTSIYYPHPVPRLRYYQERYGWDSKWFPNAQQISDYTIALPVGPTLTASQCSTVAEGVTATCAARASKCRV
jgi:perosamine synthetase